MTPVKGLRRVILHFERQGVIYVPIATPWLYRFQKQLTKLFPNKNWLLIRKLVRKQIRF